MRRIALVIIVLGLAAAAGFFLFRWFFPSDESLIRQRLIELAELVSEAASESGLARLTKANRIGSYFAPEVRIQLEGGGTVEIAGRTELVQALISIRALGQRVQIELPDIVVAVAEDRERAQADVTVKATYPDREDMDVQHVRIQLRQIEGDWLIQQAETVRTLR